MVKRLGLRASAPEPVPRSRLPGMAGSAGSTGPDGTGVRHQVDGGRLDGRARVARVHDAAVADVHPDVADRLVVEDQVARLEVALADPATLAVLRLGRVRQRDAGSGPGRH